MSQTGALIHQLLATLETKLSPKSQASTVTEELPIGARMMLRKATKTKHLFNGVKKLKKKLQLKEVGVENEYIKYQSLKSIYVKIMTK